MSTIRQTEAHAAMFEAVGVVGESEFATQHGWSRGDAESRPVGNAAWRFVGRVAEVLFAIVVLVASAPLLLLLTILIRRDSPGPAIFRQPRVGKDLKPFTFYKFRTLYVDARERFPEWYDYEFTPDHIQRLDLRELKPPDDPRVTRVGRWLRPSSLDELPNFVNVITGEMALVGPRPELPEFVKYYSPTQRLKFAVRPGVTGLAQVNGRNGNSFQAMIRHDVDYVRSRGFWLDLKVILLTIRVIVTRRGAW